MASYNKFEPFVEHLTNKVFDLFGTSAGSDCDVLKVYLSNTTPSASADSVKADLAEISAGNGYAAGGATIPTQAGARSGGTFTLSGDAVVFTASGGAFAQFRYVVLYSDTPTSPADPLISWWDHGSAVDLQNGETYTVSFNNDPTAGTIFTLA